MKRILIQLDTDELPCSFDRVAAVDAGVDHVFAYGGITPENVEPLVHGAMFTRGLGDLKNTAVFVGGSDTEVGETVFEKVQQTFFGPVRVSVMMDSNGSNTTAAAAVLAAARHVNLAGAQATVLGATVQLLAARGADVRAVSRSAARATETCNRVHTAVADARLTAVGASDEYELINAVRHAHVLIAAGAAGVQFLDQSAWKSADSLQVAIDLNAVPPAGLEGIGVTDKAVEHQGTVVYGAVGVGGTKMKIHKAAVRQLFEAGDQVIDTAAVFGIGLRLEAGSHGAT